MKELKGSVVAVTGAGSGIGRGLAVNLAKGSDPDVSHNELVEIFDTKMAKTSADKAARIIIKGIKKKQTTHSGWAGCPYHRHSAAPVSGDVSKTCGYDVVSGYSQ